MQPKTPQIYKCRTFCNRHYQENQHLTQLEELMDEYLTNRHNVNKLYNAWKKQPNDPSSFKDYINGMSELLKFAIKRYASIQFIAKKLDKKTPKREIISIEPESIKIFTEEEHNNNIKKMDLLSRDSSILEEIIKKILNLCEE